MLPPVMYNVYKKNYHKHLIPTNARVDDVHDMTSDNAPLSDELGDMTLP